MENKVVIELNRYEELMKQSFESEKLKKEVDDLKSKILKLKNIILSEYEDTYDLECHTLEECLDFTSCFCAMNKVSNLLLSGIFSKE